MNKYIVSVKEVWVSDVIIEAESEKDAISKIEGGEGDTLDSQYSYTLDSDEWTVHQI